VGRYIFAGLEAPSSLPCCRRSLSTLHFWFQLAFAAEALIPPRSRTLRSPKCPGKLVRIRNKGMATVLA
jgi:hypothetical protein